MSRVLNYVPRVAIFLAGVAAAAITLPRREARGTDLPSTEPAGNDDFKNAIVALEARLQAREVADAAHFAQIELRLDEHSVRLRDVPSTTQIVAAMEQLLTKTMTSLDHRLTAQAHSVEVLRTTVSQTDSLLERVLESLDSLQTFTDAGDFAEEPPVHRPRM